MKLRLFPLAASLAALALCVAAREAQARAGALDPSFGSGGIVATGVPAGTANALALQSDGKIVVAVSPVARGSQTTALVRLLPDGALDASFGSGGVAPVLLTSFPYAAVVNSLAVQSDGAILFCGGGLPLIDAPAFVARVRPDGSPDAGFGNGGTVLGVVPYTANVVLAEAAGDVLVAGGSTLAAAAALARLTSSGTFDGTFGNGGIASYTTTLGAVYGAAEQSDGKYLLLGNGVLSLRADGALTKRDARGRIALDAHEGSESFTPQGKTLLTQEVAFGRNDTAVQTARFLRSGAPDASFASPAVAFGYGPSNAPAYLHEAPGGEIVVDGTSTASGGATALGLVRYRANGTLDPAFGSAGTLYTQLGAQLDGAGEFVIAPDRSVVVAAVAVTGGAASLIVLRYLGK